MLPDMKKPAAQKIPAAQQSTVAIEKSGADVPVYQVYRVTRMSHSWTATERELVLETTDVAKVTRMLIEW